MLGANKIVPDPPAPNLPFHYININVIYLISVYYRNSLTVVHFFLIYHVAMLLMVDQSLATGFITINTAAEGIIVI